MSNTIDSNLQSLLNKTGQKVNGAEKGQTNGPGNASSGDSAGKINLTDTVNLTQQSLVLASVEKSVAEMPAIDQTRVDAVKADIENGDYKIDVDKLAELIMQSDQEFGD